MHTFSIQSDLNKTFITAAESSDSTHPQFLEDLFLFAVSYAWQHACDKSSSAGTVSKTRSNDAVCYQLSLDKLGDNFGLFIKIKNQNFSTLNTKVVVPSLIDDAANLMYLVVKEFFEKIKCIEVHPSVFEGYSALKQSLIALQKQIMRTSLAVKLYSVVYSETQINKLVPHFAIASTDKVFAYWRDCETNCDYAILFDKIPYADGSGAKYFLSIKARKSVTTPDFVEDQLFELIKDVVLPVHHEWTLLEYFSWNSFKEFEYMLNTPTHLKAFSFLLGHLKHKDQTANVFEKTPSEPSLLT